MTMKIKGLMLVAAVAILPVACGTSAPTGMDVAAIEAEGRMSALRSDPSLPVPPQAPEPPSPESIPLPSDPGTSVDPSTDPPAPELPSSRPPRPTPSTDPAPAPPSSDPIPAPPRGGPSTIPVPSPAPNSGTPTSVEIPAAPGSGRGTIPTPTPIPAPEECQAVSIEILSVSTTFAEPRGAGFMALLADKDGRLIEDASCEKLAWEVVGGVNDNRIDLSYGDNSRFVYVVGMSGGTYKVRATTPNHLTATLVVGAR